MSPRRRRRHASRVNGQDLAGNVDPQCTVERSLHQHRIAQIVRVFGSQGGEVSGVPAEAARRSASSDTLSMT